MCNTILRVKLINGQMLCHRKKLGEGLHPDPRTCSTPHDCRGNAYGRKPADYGNQSIRGLRVWHTTAHQTLHLYLFPPFMVLTWRIASCLRVKVVPLRKRSVWKQLLCILLCEPFRTQERFFMKVRRSNMSDQPCFMSEACRVLATFPTTEESCETLLQDF